MSQIQAQAQRSKDIEFPAETDAYELLREYVRHEAESLALQQRSKEALQQHEAIMSRQRAISKQLAPVLAGKGGFLVHDVSFGGVSKKYMVSHQYGCGLLDVEPISDAFKLRKTPAPLRVLTDDQLSEGAFHAAMIDGFTLTDDELDATIDSLDAVSLNETVVNLQAAS